ncbi:MAG: glycosyltransferase family 4 protein [Methylacidiphilales bacterium]|nr:glycosyltransferase family 4 protein [Candidatus Methylacidiphilales bacterium]
MLITYAAPNRSHHYFYATAMARAGCLKTFVCGFSRFSPRAPLPEVGNRLLRADHLQNFYLASQKLRLPAPISDELAYQSKIWIDHLAERPARASDLFLFYNGAGLHTAGHLQSTGVVRSVEAVNCHVLVQERILREEHRRLGLPFRPFHPREVARRVGEYEIADAILCPSHFVKDSFISEGFPIDRIFVVPYGLSLQTRETPISGPDNIFRVLYVGQLGVRKGLRYLFDAFARLRHPKKELWIVGPRNLQTGIEGIQPPEGTHFPGVLKGERLARAYLDASVFVLPTLEEGLALVIGEALSFGLPVIATFNSGGTDLFQDGREGFLVPIRSPEALAEKMQQLADDPGLRRQMAEAARARATELNGWETAGENLVDALKRMVRSDRKTSAASTAER